MTRRSISTLLCVFALVATGLVWISMSVIGGPAADESNSLVPATERATQRAPSEPQLAPPPSPDPVPSVEEVPTTTRTAVSEAPREDAAVPAADLELRDALWVDGRVIVPQGTPPDELVEVVANGNAFETRPLHSSPIAADGSFRVAFAPGTLLGTLDLKAKYLYLEEATTVSPAQRPQFILLTPRLGGRIHARVVLTPLALPLRPSIVGSWGRAQRPRRETIRVATIDENLEFDLAGLPAGSDYEMWISAPGCSSIPLQGVHVELGRTTLVDVDLDLGATISGRVFDGNGTAMNRTQVVARLLGDTDPDPDNREIRRTFSDPSGLFVLSELTPGTWELTAMTLGSAMSLPFSVHLSAGRSAEDVRLELRRSGRIAGRVLGIDGQPAVYAGVSVRSDQSRDRALEGTEFLVGTTRTTDKYGDFEFDSLTPGEYRIEARSADLANGGEAYRSGITLAEGDCVENVVIRIERPGRIEGRVTGPEGSPVPDVFVSVTDGETDITVATFASVKTDESGKFTLERVPPGELLIVVRGGRLAQVGETRVALRPGGVVRTEISVREGTMLWVFLEGFAESPGAVTVSVLDEKGAIVGTASPIRPQNWNGVADALACTIGPVLPGKYVIEAVAAAKKVSQPVTLSGQEVESIHLRATR